MRYVLLFLVVVQVFSSMVHATESMTIHKDSLQQILKDIYLDVNRDVKSATLCAQVLENHFQNLIQLNQDDTNLDAFTNDEIMSMSRISFMARITIMEKLNMLQISSEKEQKCLNAVKDTMLALRYVEDYLTEVYMHRTPDIDVKEFTNLKGVPPYHLVNPKFLDFEGPESLQSGDIILTRANTSSSAAIARLGEKDTQFSHLSIVYQDTDGKLYTVEAQMAGGAQIYPLKTHIGKKHTRTAVFRYKDEKMAKRAAEYIYKKVLWAQQLGVPIKYDYSMDYKKHDKVFCSELVYEAYEAASRGKVDLGIYKTKFNRGLLPFLKSIGVPVTEENFESFDLMAPSDIQFDPNFDLVAEWRNPKKLKNLRTMDAVLTRMFHWMETENYKLKPSGVEGFAAHAITPFAHLLPKLIPKMDKELLKTFVALERVSRILASHLKDFDKTRILSMYEMYQILDEFKDEDRKTWEEYQERHNSPRINLAGEFAAEFKTPNFHLLFSP